MLKNIFGSQTRVKILQLFLLNTEKEYYVRELTRKINEQINSVRRELLNLKKIGLLKYRIKNRKKYFFLCKDFILYSELKSIILKMQDPKKDIIKNIKTFGDSDLVVLAGFFTNNTKSAVDLLIISDNLDKNDFEKYLENNFQDSIKYSLMTKDDFLYRLDYKDKFIITLLKDKKNIIAINKFKRYINKVL